MTGASGFIGTNLCEELRRRGEEVVTCGHRYIPVLSVDKRFRAVVHLSAYGTRPEQLVLDEFVRSAALTRMVHTAAARQWSKVIVAGSITERMPPLGMYAASKALSSAMALASGATVLRFTTPYGPHEQPHRIVPKLIEYGMRGEFPPLSNPNNGRDYVFVDDVVDAIIRSFDAPRRSVLRRSGLRTASVVRRRHG